MTSGSSFWMRPGTRRKLSRGINGPKRNRTGKVDKLQINCIRVIYLEHHNILRELEKVGVRPRRLAQLCDALIVELTRVDVRTQDSSLCAADVYLDVTLIC